MEKVICYTDGACSKNQDGANSVGGWAYILMYKDHVKKDSGQVKLTTNNRMEILSVINALKAIKNPLIPVELYSDSNLLVSTLNLGWKRKKNQDLWEELDTLLLQFKDIKFIKVTAHADNEFNNLVDKMAVKQTKKVYL